MSKTEGFVVLDTESKASIGDKPNVEKEKKASFGNMTRKKLADISNLPQQARVSTLDEMSHLMPITTREYFDQLKKENMALGKILAERNKIIEVTGTELQKLRVNLQKMQQQNRQLAQSNSQMLADLNSGKDRLKVSQHELGCKNALLKSKKLEMEERLKTKKCEKLDDEVETNCEAAEVTKGSSKVGKDDNKCGNARRRPKSKSLAPRQVQSKDEIENKRPCVRRQSARFRSEEVKSSSNLLETEDAKVSEHFPSIDPSRGNGAVSASISIQDDGREGKCASRHDTGNKRSCVRRQSARIKSEEPKASGNSLEAEDTKIAASVLNDGSLLEDVSTSASLILKNEDDEVSPASGFETLESNRSSLSRPLRQAAKKVQSYKEVPLNIKMRRSE